MPLNCSAGIFSLAEFILYCTLGSIFNVQVQGKPLIENWSISFHACNVIKIQQNSAKSDSVSLLDCRSAVKTALSKDAKHEKVSYYLRQRGNVFAGFCLFVCLSVC